MAIISSVGSIIAWYEAVTLRQWPVYALACLSTAVLVLSILRMVRGPLRATDAAVYAAMETFQAPSRRIATKMEGEERVLWETREHPIGLLGWWLSAAGLTVAAILLIAYTTLALHIVMAGWLIGIGLVAYRVLMWWREIFVVTNRQLMVVFGIFTEEVQAVPLPRVTDKGLRIPFSSVVLARLRIVRLEYGTIILEWAGHSKLKRTFFVPHAVPLSRMISRHSFGG